VEGGSSGAVGSGELTTAEEPSVEWEVAPAYPAEFAQNPRDGIAVVNLLVDAVGAPSDAVVEYASHAAFAKAAGDAVMGWKFKPAERKGGLVSARTQVTVRFRKADATLTAEDRKRRAQLAQSRDFDVPPEEAIQVPLVYP
jgi:TonB family protein